MPHRPRRHSAKAAEEARLRPPPIRVSKKSGAASRQRRRHYGSSHSLRSIASRQASPSTTGDTDSVCAGHACDMHGRAVIHSPPCFIDEAFLVGEVAGSIVVVRRGPVKAGPAPYWPGRVAGIGPVLPGAAGGHYTPQSESTERPHGIDPQGNPGGRRSRARVGRAARRRPHP